VTYSDEELEQLLSDIESDFAERKESFAGDTSTKAREAVCAFANDLPDHRRPGVVFIGAKDSGVPSRLAITDQLLLDLSHMKTDGNILPPPTMYVEKRRLLGADMAVVSVEPSDSPPVRFKGRIWIRIGPRRAIATSQDERILSEKRRHRDLPFDARAVSQAKITDLNRLAFEEEYLPVAFAQDVLEANDRTIEQRMAATKMITSADQPIPTVMGLLVLGKNVRDFLPGAYVQFLRIKGSQLGDPIADEQVIAGTVADVIRRLDEKLSAHNTVGIEFTSSPTERRTPTYPLAALQQLTRNAIMHRTYESTNAPVQVYWFDDRIEIHNPGGPYGVVNVENFGNAGIVDYRNPNLAEAMRVLGFVQRFGFGISTARRELKANGNPVPDFMVQPNHVAVSVKRATS
jgi:ATP-dependent DNA helicase RecG